MIDPGRFYQLLRAEGVDFFAGVPDSLLKHICAYITQHHDPDKHVIAANEGAAAGLAIGSYLATGKIPLVYLQNSGLGNLINPLLSLADADVFSIPMLLMIGWRGEPGVADEPQHKKQGRVMHAMLDAMELPWINLSGDTENYQEIVREFIQSIEHNQSPGALVIRKGTFSSYSFSAAKIDFPLTREKALATILDYLPPDAPVVATTGYCSRELFELRDQRKQNHGNDFLTIGGMGHSSQIALGIGLTRPGNPIYCMDGDGSVLMHMGSMAINARSTAANLCHIVLNNGAHDSVGAQPTLGLSIDLCAVARSLGYRETIRAENEAGLKDAMVRLQSGIRPAFLEVRVTTGARNNLGRPTLSPRQTKAAFMAKLIDEC